MSLKTGIKAGFITLVVSVFFVLIGLGTVTGGVWLLWLLALTGGALGARNLAASLLFLPPTSGGDRERKRQLVLAGAGAGAVVGLFLAAFTWLMGTLIQRGADVRRVLFNVTEEAISVLSFGQDITIGSLLLLGSCLACGILGAVLYQGATLLQQQGIGAKFRMPVLSAVEGLTRDSFAQRPILQELERRGIPRWLLPGLGLVALLAVPPFLGTYWNQVLGSVGIYVLMGLGLNVVVGFAGLLIAKIVKSPLLVVSPTKQWFPETATDQASKVVFRVAARVGEAGLVMLSTTRPPDSSAK